MSKFHRFIRSFYLIVLSLFLLLPQVISGVESVTLEQSNGVPVIKADGRPIRPLCFYGGSTFDYCYSTEPRGRHNLHNDELGQLNQTAQFKLDGSEQKFSFDYKIQNDSQGVGTLHFRFDAAPGEYIFDNIELVERTTGRTIIACEGFEQKASFEKDWKCYPPSGSREGTVQIQSGIGVQGTAGLLLTIKKPQSDKYTDFHLYTQPKLNLHAGEICRVSLTIKGTPGRTLRCSMYRKGEPYLCLGGIPSVDDRNGPFEQQIRLAAGAGVHFVTFPLGLPWPKPGQDPYWKGIVKTCERILEQNPNAILLPRIKMDPPIWWLNAHPDDEYQIEKPYASSIRVASVASELWRKEAGERLRDLIGFLEKKFGPHLGGFHITGHNTSEWFYYDTWLNVHSDYSKANEKAWQKWLAQKYGSAERLSNYESSQTKGQKNTTIDKIKIPSYEKRQKSKKNDLFLDPAVKASDRELADYHQFQQEVMTDAILYFSKIAKESCSRKRLVLVFYGYHYELAAPVTGPSASGHFALQRLLESPDIDIFAAPITYGDRQPGGFASTMTCAESITRHGKMFWSEDDTRTFLVGATLGAGKGSKTLEGTIDLLTRNTAQCLTRNFGTWWMDLGLAGWYNSPELWKRMAQLQPMADYYLAHPTPFRPEIGLFIHEPSAFIVPNNRVSHLVSYIRTPVARIGAPSGQYLLNDLTEGKTNCKLNIIVNAWMLNAAERKAISEKTKGTTVFWSFGSACKDPEKAVELEEIRQLTGFRITARPSSKKPPVITENGKRSGLLIDWLARPMPELVFTVTDVRPEEVLVRHGDGSPAVCIREKTDGGYTIFCGLQLPTEEIFRLAAKKANVHLYTKENCNVYANGKYIVLHASQTGTIHLDLGKSRRIVDYLDKKEYGVHQNLTLEMKIGETKILECNE